MISVDRRSMIVIFVILSYVATTTSRQTECPDDSAPYEDRCIWLRNSAVSLADAEALCGEYMVLQEVSDGNLTWNETLQQGSLARLDNPPLAMFVAQLAVRMGGVWIKAAKPNSSSPFVWSDNRDVINWANWKSGYPDLTSSGHGIAVIEGDWVDKPPNALYYAVCELRLLPEDLSEPCAGRWLTQFGRDLSATSYKTVGNSMPHECLRACYDEDQCQSVSYQWNSKTCKLYKDNQMTATLKPTAQDAIDYYSYFCGDACKTDLIEQATTTLTSSPADTNGPPSEARLYNLPHGSMLGVFQPAFGVKEKWLKFDFGHMVNITMIQTQGKGSYGYTSAGRILYNSTINLMYSTDNVLWRPVYCQGAKTCKILTNVHGRLASEMLLDKAITVQYMLMELVGYEHFQLGLLGCPAATTIDASERLPEPVGLGSGAVMDCQMRAHTIYHESQTNVSNAPWQARLNNLYSAYLTASSLQLQSQYWQVDLLVPHNVTEMVIQGHPNLDVWTSQFKIAYSNDSFKWTYVLNADGSTKIIVGTQSRSITTFIPLDVQAQLLRIYPLPEYVQSSFRVEFYGLPIAVGDETMKDGMVTSQVPEWPCDCNQTEVDWWRLCTTGLEENDTAVTEVTYETLKLMTSFSFLYPGHVNLSAANFQFTFSTDNVTFIDFMSDQYSIEESNSTVLADYILRVYKFHKVQRLKIIRVSLDVPPEVYIPTTEEATTEATTYRMTTEFVPTTEDTTTSMMTTTVVTTQQPKTSVATEEVEEWVTEIVTEDYYDNDTMIYDEVTGVWTTEMVTTAGKTSTEATTQATTEATTEATTLLPTTEALTTTVEATTVLFTTTQAPKTGGLCFYFWIQAVHAAPCPPSFVQYGDQCLWPVPDSISVAEQGDLCQRNTWQSSATLACVQDIEEDYFIRQLLYRYDSKTWIGLHLEKGVWSWPDGWVPGFELWGPSYPAASGGPSAVARLNGTHRYWENPHPSERHAYVCNTTAVLPPNETLWRWYGMAGWRLDGVTAVSIAGLAPADCMQACLEYPDFNCSTVQVHHPSSSCFLLDANRTSLSAVPVADGNYDYFEKYYSDCDEGLVWGSGGVGGTYVTSSSASSVYKPHQASLGNKNGHWNMGGQDPIGKFIQVDLRRVVNISRVAIQGSSPSQDCYVSKFRLLTSNNSLHWKALANQFGKYKLLEGNSIDNDLMMHWFRPMIVSRFVRIEPVECVGSCCMRFELYGCNIGMPWDTGCSVELLGWGAADPATSLVAVNGRLADKGTVSADIMTVATLQMTNVGCQMHETRTFQADSAGATGLSNFVNSLSPGTVFVGATSSDFDNFKSSYAAAFSNQGVDVTELGDKEALVFIAKVGSASFAKFQIGFQGYGAVHLADILLPFSKDPADAALGMQMGRISMNQLVSSASSASWPPDAARLCYTGNDGVNGAWLAESVSPWYQIDLLIIHNIYSIIMQGSPNGEYYIMQFSLAMSNDTFTWLPHTLDDGNTSKVYDANFHRLWLMKVVLNSTIVTRALRILPVNFTGKPAIRFELTGYPSEYNRLDPVALQFLVTSGACALLRSCSQGLCHSSADTVEIDMGMLYHITMLNVHLSDPSASYQLKISYSSNSEASPQTEVPDNQVFARFDSNKNSTLYIFSPHIRAWKLLIALPSTTKTVCSSIDIHGTEASPCPAGMILDGGMCFYIHPVPAMFWYMEKGCKKIKWTDVATQPKTNTYNTINQYHKFYVPRSSEAMVGLHRSNNQWYWQDGQLASWVNWAATPTAGYDCAKLRNDAKIVAIPCDINNRQIAACVTPAAVKDIEDCLPTWTARPDTRIELDAIGHTSEFQNLLMCLDWCQRYYPQENVSVDVSFSEMLCFCYDGNSTNTVTNLTTAQVYDEPGYVHYEVYCKPMNCSAPLRQYLSPSHIIVVTSQSSYTGLNVGMTALDFQPTGWRAATYDIPNKEWIQIMYDKPVLIYEIIVQGPGHVDGYTITKFSLMYKNKASPGWTPYLENDSPDTKLFPGPSDSYWHYHVVLQTPIKADTVQIIPEEVNSLGLGLRFDMSGCLIDDADLLSLDGYALGMESGDIGDNQLAASSWKYDTKYNYYCPPVAGRYNFPKSYYFDFAWIPTVTNNAWYQVMFGSPYEIQGILLQESLPILSGRDAGKPYGYIKTYKVSHSQDGQQWIYVKLPNGDQQVFAGSVQLYFSYPAFTPFTPYITTRNVRIYPIAYQSSMAMRFEVFGKAPADKMAALLTSATSDMVLAATTQSTACNDGNVTIIPSYMKSLNCSSWCFSISQTAQLTLDMAATYFVYRLEVKAMQSLSSFTTSLRYRSYSVETWKPLPIGLWTTLPNGKYYTLKIPRVMRYIELSVTPVNTSIVRSECLRLNAYGEKTMSCPVGYAQYESRCFRHVRTPVTATEAKQYCEAEGENWLYGTGTLAKPDDIYIADFFRSIATTDYLRQSWSGAASIGGSSWEWSDGSPVSWIHWVRGVTFPNDKLWAVYDDYSRLYPEKEAQRRNYICEVKASVTGENSDIMWIYIKNQKIVATPPFVQLVEVNRTECLKACIDGVFVSGCSSVVYMKHNATCWLMQATRYSGGLVLDYDASNYNKDYWEILRRGTCDIPLMRTKPIPVTWRVTSKNNDQADPRYAVYGVIPPDNYAFYAGYWLPTEKDPLDILNLGSGYKFQGYMEVAMAVPVTITRLVIAGSYNGFNEFVTEFRLNSSIDNITYYAVVDPLTGLETFKGNTDTVNPVSVSFPSLPLGKYFRIWNTAYNNKPGLQLELFGCIYKEPLSCFQMASPTISPPGFLSIALGCMKHWTVIMRHETPSFSFRKSWSAYKNGFGTVQSDYWAGNFLLYYLTKSRSYYLRADIWATDGYFYAAEFSSFSLLDETKKFQMTIGQYNGGSAGPAGMVSSYSGQKFATYDNDNSNTCANKYNGGWWYKSAPSCMDGRLTGALDLNTTAGTVWTTYKNEPIYATKVLMRIHPSDSDQINLALERQVWNFPEHSDPSKKELAVDGDVGFNVQDGDCLQAPQGKDPWFLVDLGRDYYVSEVRIRNGDDTSSFLQDFDVYVGTFYIDGNFSAAGYELCSAYVGTASSGEMVSLSCPQPISGRYVALQLAGLKVLTVCEIMVYAATVGGGLYKPCTWNRECVDEFTECRPNWGDKTESFLCRCRRYYRDVNGKCVPLTDIRPTITSLQTLPSKMIRGYTNQANLTMNITHMDGATIPLASPGDINFQSEFYLTKTNVKPYTSPGDTVYATAWVNVATYPNLTLGLLDDSFLLLDYELEFFIPQDICREFAFICVNVTAGQGATFIETNAEDNVACFPLPPYIDCQPAIDVGLKNGTYIGTKQIIRGIPGRYVFTLTIAHMTGDYDIFPYTQGLTNHEVLYFYASLDRSYYPSLTTDYVLYNGVISNDTAASKLFIKEEKVFQVEVTQGMTIWECLSTTHICFLIRNTIVSSYKEMNYTDNVFCSPLHWIKDCEPGTEVNMKLFSIDPSFRFIRGYFDPMPFTVMLKNDDFFFDVIHYPNLKRDNFNFTLWLSTANLTATTDSSVYETLGPYLSKVNEDLTAGLAVGKSITFTGTIDAMVTREMCADFSYICLEMEPANTASFELFLDACNMICIDGSPYKNCAGLPVQGAEFLNDTHLIMLNNSVNFTTLWQIGTDLQFSIDFDDGHTYSWDWFNGSHTLKYRKKAVSVSHNYYDFGNYTVSVNISNQLSYVLLDLAIIVEPPLDKFVYFTDASIPMYVPNPLRFDVIVLDVNELDVPILVWCSSYYDDPDSPYDIEIDQFGIVTEHPYTWTHVYLTDKPDATATITCVNHISSISHTATVILQQPVDGLDVLPEVLQWPTFVPLMFNLTVQTGSHVKFRIDYNDGSTVNLTHHNRLSFSETFTTFHTYRLPYNYSVDAVAFNKHFNTSYSSSYEIIIQNVVKNLTLFGDTIIAWPPGTNIYTLIPNPTVPLPTNPFCQYVFEDAEMSLDFAVNITDGFSHEAEFYYDREFIGRNLTVKVDCYNLVSLQTLETWLFVYEVIENLTFWSNKVAVQPHENFTLELQVVNGSNVIYDIDFDDGEVRQVTHPLVFANQANVTVDKFYKFIGNYTIKITAWNAVGNQVSVLSHEIVVQNAITNLTIWANDSVLYTPAEIDFFINPGQGQLQMTDAHFDFSFNHRRPTHYYLPSFALGDVFHDMLAFDRSYLGMMNTTVNCSNMVSWFMLNVSTDVILDAVILRSLELNESVYWQNISVFFLNVTRFGSRACFLWDMGDNISRTLYGLDVCRNDAVRLGIDFILIDDQTMLIQHEYEYLDWGVFDVEVFAYNHVSNDTLMTKGIVLEWYCLVPNITLPANATDPYNPLTYMRSQYFEIPTLIDQDCIKTPHVLVTWDVYRIDNPDQLPYTYNTKPFYTQYNVENFIHKVRMLPYGTYYLNITIQMKNVVGTNNSAAAYLKIIKTPLTVKFTGPLVESIELNSPLTLNAVNKTIDHDVEPNNKTGMTYEWYCERVNGTFNFSLLNNAEIYKDARMMRMVKEPWGCVGEPVGIMPYQQGIYPFLTEYLVPGSYYLIKVTVRKDTREGTAAKYISVPPFRPPVVELRCRENCKERKGVASTLVIAADCYGDCSTRFGGLRYYWRLYSSEENKNNFKEIDFLEAKTETGIQEKSIFMKPNTLVGGLDHLMIATVWTPGSLEAIANLTFLTNQPAYGGSCTVHPRKGTASITCFVVSCKGWKEWRPTIPDAPLKYDFRTKQPSSQHDFPISFGYSPITECTGFPVGEQSGTSFDLDVVVYIYDSVNDPKIYTTTVQVEPQPKPAHEVMSAIMAATSDGDGNPIDTLLKNGSTQAAVSMAYAMTSELNVPTKFYKGVVDDPELLKNITRNKIQARQNLINLATTFPVEEPEALLQNTEVMRTVLLKKDELEINGLEAGTNRLGNLTETFREFKRNGSVEKPAQMAGDLIGGTLTCMIAADYFYQEARKRANGTEDYVTTMAPFNVTTPGYENITDEELNRVQEQAASIMRQGVKNSRNILDIIAEDKEPGDPDDIIIRPSVTARVQTMNDKQMKVINTIESEQGGVALPPGKALFGTEVGCIENKVMFTDFNPWIYGNQSEIKVESSTMDMRLHRCIIKTYSDRSRIKRSIPVVETIQPVIPFTVTLKPKNLPEPIVVDEPKATGLVYHTIEISTPTKPIQINIYPRDFEILEVFMDINNKPTTYNYTWNFTMPLSSYINLENQTYDENFTLPEAAYTITLSALQLEMALNGTLDLFRKKEDNHWDYEFEEDENSTATTVTDMLTTTAEGPTTTTEAPDIPTTETTTATESWNNATTEAYNLTAEEPGNKTLILGIRFGSCFDGVQCEGGVGISYRIRITEIRIQLWDEVNELWNEMETDVEEDSTPTELRFKSHLFGSLGAGMFSGPNTINFSNLLDNLGGKIIDNMPVIATVLGILLLYIPALIYCRRKDKLDAAKWGTLPLIGNAVTAQYHYEIHVYTGLKRHSQTDSKVYFVLSGSNGDTGIRRLHDGKRINFQRGDINLFLLTSPYDLGEVLTLRIWHDSSGAGNNCGWYLDKVVVIDSQTTHWWVFHNNKWLDKEKGEKKTEQLLRVSTFGTSTNTGTLLRNNLNRKLFDDHVWLSVAFRNTPSVFTRAQRLSVCLAILYLTMITNAMWYKGTDEGTTAKGGTIRLGPITITMTELTNSIIASLIVIPPILFITLFFTKSAPVPRKEWKMEDANLQDMYYTKQRKPESHVTPRQHRIITPSTREGDKKKYPLPHWCIVLGWILIALSVAVSAFFTILYALDWGGTKSRAWLTAFFLSFFESVLLVQPVKVILISALLSFLFKKDTDVNEYEESYGQQQNWFDIFTNPDLINAEINTNDIEQSQKKKSMDSKISGMIREIMLQGFFLLMLLIVAYGNQGSEVYRQNSDLRNRLGDYEKLRKPQEIHKWLREDLLDALYYHKDYKGNVVSAYDQKFVSNTYAMRLGPPRLRQLRVKKEHCSVPVPADLATKRCTYAYSLTSGHLDRAHHAVNWTSAPEIFPAKMTNVEKAFLYNSTSELKGLSFWGYLTTYDGGGYVANLGLTKPEAMKTLQGLNDTKWIDEFTRIVLVEFGVMNMQSGLFTQVVISFEMPPVGGLFFWTDIRSVKLYRYTGGAGVVAIFTEILCALVFLVMTVFLLIDIVEEKCRWLKQFWNYIVLFASVFFVIALSVYAYRSVWTVRSVEYMMNHWGEVANFQIVTTSDYLFLTFLGLAIFLVILQFLHILRYNQTIAILTTTISQSAPELASMGFVAFITYAAFLSLGHLAFGSRYGEYGSLKNAALALCSNFLGNFDYKSVRQALGTPGQIYLILYLCTMIFIMANLFITLLCNYMEAVKSDDSVVPRDHEVVDYFFENLKGLVAGEDDKDKTEEGVSDAGISNILFGDRKIPDSSTMKVKKVIYQSE